MSIEPGFLHRYSITIFEACMVWHSLNTCLVQFLGCRVAFVSKFINTRYSQSHFQDWILKRKLILCTDTSSLLFQGKGVHVYFKRIIVSNMDIEWLLSVRLIIYTWLLLIHVTLKGNRQCHIFQRICPW